MNEEHDAPLRLFRTLGIWFAFLALCLCAWGLIARAEVLDKRVYMPVVIGGGVPCDPRKGIIGLVLTTKEANASYRAMGICSGTQWQAMFSTPYLPPYPLPFVPTSMVKTNPGAVVFVQYYGFTCSGNVLDCVVSAVEGKGLLDILFSNEPDNPDPNYGDAISPTQLAANFKTVRDAIWAANPQVRFVCCSFLWSNAYYFDQFKAAFAQQNNGEDVRQSIHAYAWHLYGNVGAPWNCQPPYNYAQHSPCVLANIDTQLSNIVNTMQAIDPGKSWWITEFAADSTGISSAANYAAFVGPICAKVKASAAVHYFMFLGTPWQPAINASVLDAQHNLTAVGTAYGSC